MEKGSLPLLEQLEAARVAALAKEHELSSLKEKFLELKGLSRRRKNQGKRKASEINRLKYEIEGLKEHVNHLLDITDSFDHERIRFCEEKRELLERLAHQEEMIDELEGMVESQERGNRGVKWGWVGLGFMVGTLGGFLLSK